VCALRQMATSSEAVAMAQYTPIQAHTPSAFALGIMVVPSNAAYRTYARKTWLEEAVEHASVKFVAGDVPCARKLLSHEAEAHGDIVFVQSGDCEKWHSPAKVHAWYTFALRQYPHASWIGKMEDDGMLWTSAVVSALASIRHAHSSVYVGMMQWQGSCELSDVKGSNTEDPTTGDAQPCLGCWGGWFKGGAPAPSKCGMGDRGSLWKLNWAGSIRQGGDACPRFRLAPFACGPFEARSRHLARQISGCEYAKRYFDAMSRRGDLRRNWCVSADGGQGNALGFCAKSVHVADLGMRRQKYATEKQLNESHSVLIVHPIKSHSGQVTKRMLDTWRGTWTYLTRAPAVHVPIAQARVHFRHNDSQPLVEKDRPYKPSSSPRAAVKINNRPIESRPSRGGGALAATARTRPPGADVEVKLAVRHAPGEEGAHATPDPAGRAASSSTS
jgi:hypothetical protein